MSEAVAATVLYVLWLNAFRRSVEKAISDREPFLYLTIQKPDVPRSKRVHIGGHRGPLGFVVQITPLDGFCAVSLRFDKLKRVRNWCHKEAERLA